jgi:PHD/YefM family antitoxin component YafN of YafNO toxin-antitoxin module
VDEIQALLQEYEEWLEALPESLHSSSLAERLRETVDQLTQAIDVLSQIELPRGFGRD